MEPIYAVYPGGVVSKTDGQRHHITAQQLCRLYGVLLEDCVVVYGHYYRDRSMREFIERADKLIPLVPRYDGKYRLRKRVGSNIHRED